MLHTTVELLDDPNGLVSKCGISARKLILKRGENVLEFPSVEVIARAEEAYT